MWKRIKKIIKSILNIPFTVVKGAANFIYEILRAFKRMIVSILKSPILLSIQAYKKGLIIRDYVMAKIDYLDQESKKWHRFFQVLASPYNLLLKLGFNPAMASGLLIAGGTVTTGVVATEIIQERSFANDDYSNYLIN